MYERCCAAVSRQRSRVAGRTGFKQEDDMKKMNSWLLVAALIICTVLGKNMQYAGETI